MIGLQARIAEMEAMTCKLITKLHQELKTCAELQSKLHAVQSVSENDEGGIRIPDCGDEKLVRATITGKRLRIDLGESTPCTSDL